MTYIIVLLIKLSFAVGTYTLLLEYKPEHALPLTIAILDA